MEEPKSRNEKLLSDIYDEMSKFGISEIKIDENTSRNENLLTKIYETLKQINPSGGGGESGDGYSKAEVDAKIQVVRDLIETDYATKIELSNKLDTTMASATYATKTELEDKLDTTTASTTYATKTDLNNKLDTTTASKTYAAKTDIANLESADTTIEKEIETLKSDVGNNTNEITKCVKESKIAEIFNEYGISGTSPYATNVTQIVEYIGKVDDIESELKTFKGLKIKKLSDQRINIGPTATTRFVTIGLIIAVIPTTATQWRVIPFITNINGLTQIEYSFTSFATDTKNWNVSDVPTINADVYIIDTSGLTIQ